MCWWLYFEDDRRTVLSRPELQIRMLPQNFVALVCFSRLRKQVAYLVPMSKPHYELVFPLVFPSVMIGFQIFVLVGDVPSLSVQRKLRASNWSACACAFWTKNLGSVDRCYRFAQLLLKPCSLAARLLDLSKFDRPRSFVNRHNSFFRSEITLFLSGCEGLYRLISTREILDRTPILSCMQHSEKPFHDRLRDSRRLRVAILLQIHHRAFFSVLSALQLLPNQCDFVFFTNLLTKWFQLW